MRRLSHAHTYEILALPTVAVNWISPHVGATHHGTCSYGIPATFRCSRAYCSMDVCERLCTPPLPSQHSFFLSHFCLVTQPFSTDPLSGGPTFSPD